MDTVTERYACVRSTATNIPRKRYVRSVPEQPTATERSDEPWAYYTSTEQLRENKGGDVKRAEAEARTREHDRPIFMPAGPDGSRPWHGGRDSWVGGPEDNPRRSSHVRMTFIDGLDMMPN